MHWSDCKCDSLKSDWSSFVASFQRQVKMLTNLYSGTLSKFLTSKITSKKSLKEAKTTFTVKSVIAKGG
jgi:hypothetical protein